MTIDLVHGARPRKRDAITTINPPPKKRPTLHLFKMTPPVIEPKDTSANASSSSAAESK